RSLMQIRAVLDHKGGEVAMARIEEVVERVTDEAFVEVHLATALNQFLEPFAAPTKRRRRDGREAIGAPRCRAAIDEERGGTWVAIIDGQSERTNDQKTAVRHGNIDSGGEH